MSAALRRVAGAGILVMACLAGCTEWRRDCLSEDGCRKYGFCFPTYGTCVAEKDGDCFSAEICQKEGKCIASGGVCVNPAGDGGRDARLER